MKIHACIEEILLSSEEIDAKCAELGRVITENYADKTPILIGLLKGCVPFMARLVQFVECDMEMEFIDVSSYEGTQSTGKITILRDIGCSIEDRHILLVDDIVDTGLTLNEVIALMKKRKAASVETITLVDKPEGRKIHGLHPKYVGYKIPNRFVVGFGLDYNELYRNLPYIGILKKSVYEK